MSRRRRRGRGGQVPILPFLCAGGIIFAAFLVVVLLNDAMGGQLPLPTAAQIESAAAEDGTLRPCSGWTEIFIYPGYQFKVLDCLITNFHLPESTLLMLVSALAGKEKIMTAYKEAVEQKYRFFSFGDAMFIK